MKKSLVVVPGDDPGRGETKPSLAEPCPYPRPALYIRSTKRFPQAMLPVSVISILSIVGLVMKTQMGYAQCYRM